MPPGWVQPTPNSMGNSSVAASDGSFMAGGEGMGLRTQAKEALRTRKLTHPTMRYLSLERVPERSDGCCVNLVAARKGGSGYRAECGRVAYVLTEFHG